MTPEVAYPEFRKFIPLAKVEDGPNGLATLYSIATSEAVDKDQELCDYPSTKPGYQEWSRESFDATTRAGQQPSLGNIRQQHGIEIFGKAVQIDYLDDKKQIWLKAEAGDERTSGMLRRGIFTGLSQGGKYNWRRCNECATDIPQKNYCPKCSKQVVVRYSATPSEISVVDKPCNPEATFLWVKANGSTELVKAAGTSDVHSLPCPTCGEDAPDGAEKCPKCGCADSERDAAEKAAREPDGRAKPIPRHPTGRWAPRMAGEFEDCLTAAGYSHTRTGTAVQSGTPAEPTATACYSHKDGRQRVTVQEDGAWEHEDGKGRRVTGSGKDALASHLATCGKAASGKDTNDMTDVAVQELVKAEVSAAVGPLQKDLSHVAYMSSILANLARLRDMVAAEAKQENDDRDVAIVLSLNRLIDDGSAILKDIVEDETTELTDGSGEDEGPMQLMAAAKAVGGIDSAITTLNNL